MTVLQAVVATKISGQPITSIVPGREAAIAYTPDFFIRFAADGTTSVNHTLSHTGEMWYKQDSVYLGPDNKIRSIVLGKREKEGIPPTFFRILNEKGDFKIIDEIGPGGSTPRSMPIGLLPDIVRAVGAGAWKFFENILPDLIALKREQKVAEILVPFAKQQLLE